MSSDPGPSPLAAGEANLSVAQARAQIETALHPIEGTQEIGLAEALGRVLARDVVSPIDVPAHDNSAMDGYAFAASALREDRAVVLNEIGTILAGATFDETVGGGECVRIMTGAVLPSGVDTVVPLELCRVEGRQVRIEPGAIQPCENRRRRGEDLAFGKVAVGSGRVLKPSDLGLIASLGIDRVVVMRRLRVALFSTGNELRTLGQHLDPGCVYDSNRFSLMGALQRLGMEVIDLGVVRDDPLALQAVLQAAVNESDVILTSGGVSAGDADHTRDVLGRMGKVMFWKVAMRPGRPFAFGPLVAGDPDRRTWLFALPGNPVAALVTFYVFARDALLRLAGARPEPLPVLKARCVHAVRKRPGRTEFQRGRVAQASDGSWEVQISGSQGAGILRSMSEANCLVVLGHEQGSVAAGEAVDVWLFEGLT